METGLELEDEMSKRPQKKFNGPTRKKAKKKMPKGYKPVEHAETCSFCNKHMDEVPLLVKSTVTNATVCSVCAMAITEQTMHHMSNVSAAYKETVMAHPEWFEQDPETKALRLIPADQRLDDAVDKNNGH